MKTTLLATVSAEDLRVAIARSGIPAYVIGARARVNPIKLSRLIRGHDRITPDVAARILLAISQEAAIAKGISKRILPTLEALDRTVTASEPKEGLR